MSLEMPKFQPELPLIMDVMVEEANIYDLSWKVILADSVLKHYIGNIFRFAEVTGSHLLYQRMVSRRA